jgi:Phytanoyl-CoA dioxygenase (PhyH)
MSIAQCIDTPISRKIFGEPGYSIDIKLNRTELTAIREFISDQWITRIRELHPDLAERFAADGLEKYHRHSHLVEHDRLWPKRYRLFSPSVVAQVKQFPVIDELRRAFGDFSISDVTYGDKIETGVEEVYWRLVRPNAESDVGPLHADKWFHESLADGRGMFSPTTTTVKVWLPVFAEPGRNGLLVVPGSHKKTWRYRNLNKGGALKPQIEEDVDSLGAVLVPTEPGTLVLFNERLLHGGAVNRGDSSRVSVEITLVFE